MSVSKCDLLLPSSLMGDLFLWVGPDVGLMGLGFVPHHWWDLASFARGLVEAEECHITDRT